MIGLLQTCVLLTIEEKAKKKHPQFVKEWETYYDNLKWYQTGLRYDQWLKKNKDIKP